MGRCDHDAMFSEQRIATGSAREAGSAAGRRRCAVARSRIRRCGHSQAFRRPIGKSVAPRMKMPGTAWSCNRPWKVGSAMGRVQIENSRRLECPIGDGSRDKSVARPFGEDLSGLARYPANLGKRKVRTDLNLRPHRRDWQAEMGRTAIADRLSTLR